MSHHLMRRAGLALATGAVALTGTLTTAPAASAAPADRSADWLANELEGGVMHNPQFDFDDYQLTADAAYALREVGGHGRDLQRMRRALERDVDSWTTGADFGDPDTVYGNSAAKALVFAQEVRKADPRDFGGVDLVQRLEGVVAETGRLSGSNTVGQAFASRGLADAGSAEGPAAVDFLLLQQCDEGYFRLGYGSPDDAAQGCEANGGEADFDATALAVLNLQALAAPGPATEAAVTAAVGWMSAQQRGNGSFGGGPGTEQSNANSTGLAAWALGQAGRCGKAADAAGWAKRLRLTDGADAGAIALDRDAYRKAQRRGITSRSSDQFRRATSQAAPGLEYLRKRDCRRG